MLRIEKGAEGDCRTAAVERPHLRITFALVALLATASAWAIGPSAPNREAPRHFDARVAHNRAFTATISDVQRRAAEALRARSTGVQIRYDRAQGVASSLNNPTGYLSAPDSGFEPGSNAGESAIEFARAQRDVLGLTDDDLSDFEVTDEVYSAATGAAHVYLRQRYRGLPVYNAQLQVNINRAGRVISLSNGFVRRIAHSAGPVVAPRPADQALQAAAEHLGLTPRTPPAILSVEDGPGQRAELSQPDLSTEPIVAQLMWLPIRAGNVRLVWNFQLVTPDGQHHYDINVDARSGKVWTRIDWVSSHSFKVYEQPVESPNHTTPLPPVDARTWAVDPEEPTASPNDWLTDPDGVMAGNNAHACLDAVAPDGCDAGEPSCAGGLCEFAMDLTQEPSSYAAAAVANLFYWNNRIHDVQYQYGFDEAAGNFQEDNGVHGGLGSDSVIAEAQDYLDLCNAYFSVPVDGVNPRMQLFVCPVDIPSRDADLDNGVIVHEYGHGISVRQVGGPANSSCLGNTQQPGEGWSDWFALAYTAETGDLGADARGIGTYLFAQPPDGTGIRLKPYSTDPAVNDWTYESIAGKPVPHDLGAVWAQALWEVYWALVDQYGFDENILDPVAGGWFGNHRALLYVNEGLKNTACSPTFLDARDGIIQAATDNFGGVDVCLLWDAFAQFGLGVDAWTGGPFSQSATNGFDTPIACQCQPAPIADAGPDQLICLGESTVVGTPAQPDNTYAWSPGGETTAEITVSPAVDTTYTVTATTSLCGSDSDPVTVRVDSDGSGGGLSENFEGDTSGWTATGLWHLTNDSNCASPGYSSPFHAFYYGQDTGDYGNCNYQTIMPELSFPGNTGTLTSPVITGIDAASTLSFDYYRVVEDSTGAFGDYDITEVEIVTASGATVVWSRTSQDPSTAAWQSSEPIDLSAFAGKQIQVRFRFDSFDGEMNQYTGWLIDDVVITGPSPCTEPPLNTAPAVSVATSLVDPSFTSGDPVTFTGSATDAEDGDLSANLAWTSDKDGPIGDGASVTTTSLSVDIHTITASVTDSGGLSGVSSITVTIDPPAPPPSPCGGVCVSDIVLSLENKKRNRRARAAVSLTDGASVVVGATVTGAWDDPANTPITISDSDGNGVAVQTSGWAPKSAGGQFIFYVQAVSSGAGTLDETNSVLSACINADGSPCTAPPEPPPPPPPGEDIPMHVDSNIVAVQKKGKNYTGRATVVIVETGSSTAVAGATVTGSWTLPGGATPSASGTTSSSGTAVINSPKDQTGGTYTFCVNDVAKDGYVWDDALPAEGLCSSP